MKPIEESRVRLTPLQRITVDRLERAQGTVVPVTLQTEARAEGLMRARNNLQMPDGRHPTVTAALARLVATALMDHPQVNRSLVGEEMVLHTSASLGIAVSADDGSLSVPVLHNVESMSVQDLGMAIQNAADRARARKLGLEDVRGGVFTLSNVGMVAGQLHANPLIPLGHTGILLVGGVYAKPVVVEDRVESGLVFSLSMTFDHRVVNGVPAVEFLNHLIVRIEQPEDWL